jgi:predicted methyltransferase
MRLFTALLPLALVAAPLAAKPTDYARAVADPARSEADRKLDASRQPAEVLDFAGVAKGQAIADFMAGNGYFTGLMAAAVGPKGTVYAMDPPSFHDPKAWEKGPNARANIRILLAPVQAMKLAPASIDTMFAHLSYHDLYWESEKYKFPRIDVPAVLADWYRAVKPGGHVIVIDHWGPAGDPREVTDKLHRIDPDRVKADMAAAGFVLESESPMLRRSEDDRSKLVFDPAVRGKTDRFALKFRRP